MNRLNLSLGKGKRGRPAGMPAPRAPRRRTRFMNALVAGRIRIGGRTSGRVAGVRAATRTSSAVAWGSHATVTAIRPLGARVLVGVRSARTLSLVLLLACLGAFAYLVNAPEFYVVQPVVSGREYLTLKDVYRMTGAPGLHIFWVDPAAMAAALEASPSVEHARVTVGWPDRVEIALVERTPVAIWKQAGATSWVAADGRLMPVRGTLANALSIVVRDADTRPLPEQQVAVPAETVQAALALRALRPNIVSLNYFQRGGLEYDDGRGWQAYFGTGNDMPQKLAIYERLVDHLLHERGLQASQIEYIVVTDVQHPFYRLRDEQ
jgi:cell division septal protein FtsQ